MKVQYPLIVLGIFVLNHPFLAIFEKKYTLLSVPVFIVALFAVWAAVILFLFLAYRKEGK